MAKNTGATNGGSTAFIKVKIAGVTPLICNKFTDAAALKASSGSTVSTVGHRGTPQEIAEGRLYLSAQDGKPCIPQPNLLRCLMDGGTFFKVGKSKVTTQKSSLIPACVELREVEYPIEHKQPWKVDTRAVRIPSTGGRVLAHRPCFDDWALSFEVELDQSIMSAELLREILDASGKRIGLGDFRPNCKGPYGRFVVVSWKIGV